ncbi:uncharacterized protein LOC143046703 isoform X2 [Mytilus galloprovincialis]|uniref:uncharacterized protein LOC143046703 isoform X2 n=1 Tax=Mytilus galloprovincialis TaxID=29158 RepID=UPI003F7C4DFD
MEGLTKAYTYESLLILFSVIIFPDEVVSWGTKLQTTNHISGWIPMRSQDNSLSYHVWNHSLNDLPVRVDVQVKPKTGTDTDYVFPGIAAAQRDDSLKVPYGGIVYKYNKDSVMLFAPNKHLGKPSGHAIYTGGSVWNGPKQQQESDVLTIVRVWGEQHFPKPDFTYDWKPIQMGERSPRVVQHNFGVQPAYVVLQIKFGSTDDVADGIGYMMAIESSFNGDKWGGVPYAYNDKNIRVWTRFRGGTLFTIPEGWGKTQEKHKSGQYRIFAWKSLGAKSHNVHKLKLPSSSTNELRFSTPINKNNDIVQVMVKELTGSSGHNQNAGYLFKATGAVQNTQNSSYGGVVYSYSNQSSRVWYPPVHAHGKQYLMYIDTLFGSPSSTAILAELEITTFVPYDSLTTTPMTSTTATTTISTTQSTKTSTTKMTTSAQPTTTTPKSTTSISTTTSPKRTTTTSTLPTSTTTTSMSTKTTPIDTTTTSTLATTAKSKPTSTIVTSTTTLTNGVTNKQISSNTVKLCKLKFDYWVYILIGFGSCLVLVSIIWLSWYCLRSKDSKVTNIIEDKKRKTSLSTSVTKKEAWSLDFI